MGRSLLLAFGIICLCVITVYGQGDRRGGQRLRTFRPRTQRPITSAPTTSAPSAPSGSAAGRRSQAQAAAGDRRNKANTRTATETRGVANTVPIFTPAGAAPFNTKNAGSQKYVPTAQGTFQIHNGKVEIYGHFYWLCQGGLYWEGAYICCNDVAIPQSSSDPVECCGIDYYFPNSEICCGDYYYPSEEYGYTAECCGDVYYLPEVETCCQGDFREKADWGCCNNAWYYKSTHGCCNHSWYSKSAHECCAGVQHAKKNNYSCCGQLYHSSAFVCCSGEPFHKQYHSCCLGQRYIHLTHKCCPNDAIIPINQNCY